MARLWRVFWLFTEFSWSIATKGHQVDTLELFSVESDLLFIVWFGRYGHVAATPPERIVRGLKSMSTVFCPEYNQSDLKPLRKSLVVRRDLDNTIHIHTKYDSWRLAGVEEVRTII